MNKQSIRGNIYYYNNLILDCPLIIINIIIIIIIIIMIKVAMTVTKSNHFPGYLVSDEGMLTLSASSHHNQSNESGREQGLAAKELREKQKYNTLT